MREEKICFHIDGESFTDLVRSIWADEDEPAKALNILEAGFPNLAEADRYAILCGDKKLLGDSREGLQLVPDDVKQSKHGNSLHAKDVIAKQAPRIDRLEDQYQLAAGQVARVASPKGLVEIPQRRLKAWRRGDATLETVPYRLTERAEVLANEGMFAHSEEAEEAEQEPSPKPDKYISGADGWLAPDGKFYRCGVQEHIALSDALGKTCEQLEKLGWIKLSGGKAFEPEKQATQAQIDLVYDWCKKEKITQPYWLEDILGEVKQ